MANVCSAKYRPLLVDVDYDPNALPGLIDLRDPVTLADLFDFTKTCFLLSLLEFLQALTSENT